MPNKISSLKIDGFRGATVPVEITLDPSKPVTVVFGENGTGKSTFADAVDFVCNRTCGSLHGGHGLGSPAKTYMSSINKQASDIRVSVSDGKTEWTARMGPDGPVVSPGDCPDAQVLRRKTMLGLIEAQPRERFEALKAFVDLPGVESSERALRDALNAVESEFGESVRALQQSLAGLDRLWNDEGGPGSSAVDWAETESSKNISELSSTLETAESLVRGLVATAAGLERLESAAEELEAARTVATTSHALVANLEAKGKSHEAELLTLLTQARSYLGAHVGLTECPVCQQPVDPDDLAGRIGDRVGAMQELASAVSAFGTASMAVGQKAAVHTESRSRFCREVRAVGIEFQASPILEAQIPGLAWDECREFLSGDDSSAGSEASGRRLVAAMGVCGAALRARIAADHKTINHHNAVRGHAEAIRARTDESTRLEGSKNRLDLILLIVSEQRKNYVDELLAGLADEVEALYSQIHPGERIGRIRLFLRPNMIGSLELDANFNDVTAIPPRAYYSDSHLDTLGICVFVALAKRFKTERTILVLDDVLTSVDAQHLDRFITMIHDQAAHFSQVVVMTHYRPWRDRYRWAKGDAARTQVIELGPWTLAAGVNIVDFLAALDELGIVAVAAPFDRQTAASKAGIVLESLLDFLTLKYRCRVNRNTRNEYALGELAAAIDSKLSKELRSRASVTARQAMPEVQLKPLIETAVAYPWVRNAVGCHFGSSGSNVTDAEVHEFCDAVLRLASHLICSVCKTLPTRRPSGSRWQCKCGDLELDPLIYPGADPSTVDDEEA